MQVNRCVIFHFGYILEVEYNNIYTVHLISISIYILS